MMTEASCVIDHFEEPLLEFRYGQELVFPRDGLFLFGPVDSTESLRSIKYGAIGTEEGVLRLQQWAASVSGWISEPPRRPGAKAVEPHHVPFPGLAEAFHCEWPATPSNTIDDILPEEIDRALRIDNRHEAIKSLVDLFVDRLTQECARIEDAPAFWFVVVPESVYRFGRPESPRLPERTPGRVAMSKQRAGRLAHQPSLFEADNEEAETYRYVPDFRRQLKARLLDEKIVTQIVRETTLTPDQFVTPSGHPLRRLEDPATVAWKLGTAAYYKAGGKPWQLARVRDGVCYVGLSYKRADAVNSERNACCAAQMFLSNGDGVVFRGALGPWYQPDRRQFHLDAAAAGKLAAMVVSEYSRIHGHPPRELFLHAQAAFSDEEWQGFVDGTGSSTELVGVQIRGGAAELKLFPRGRGQPSRPESGCDPFGMVADGDRLMGNEDVIEVGHAALERLFFETRPATTVFNVVMAKGCGSGIAVEACSLRRGLGEAEGGGGLFGETAEVGVLADSLSANLGSWKWSLGVTTDLWWATATRFVAATVPPTCARCGRPPGHANAGVRGDGTPQGCPLRWLGVVRRSWPFTKDLYTRRGLARRPNWTILVPWTTTRP